MNGIKRCEYVVNGLGQHGCYVARQWLWSPAQKGQMGKGWWGSKMACWSCVAWDNIVVKWHSNGCNPGSKMANGRGLAVGREQYVDWAGSYNKGQDNRIRGSANWIPGGVKLYLVLDWTGQANGNVPVVMVKRRNG